MFRAVKVFGVAILFLAAFSQPAMSREFADIYTECGLGAMIAPRNGAVAAVTNVTWDWGTTAISSNISSPDTCKGGQEKTAAFINDSYESLEKDLASGSGAYLDTLMLLAGVNAQAKPEFITALRSDFAEVVADANYTDQSRFEKAQTLYRLVYRHAGAIS